MSPCGQNDFTSSSSFQAVRGKATTALQPGAFQLKQKSFREISGLARQIGF